MSTTTTNYPVNPKYAEHARVATEAVLRAAFVTSKVQGGIKERKKDTEEKEDKSPVTVADYASQSLISHLLSLSFPNLPLIGEEDTTSLRSNKSMTSTIVDLVNQALALDSPEVGGKSLEKLSEEDVLKSIDRGNAEGGREGEFWTCDPIDGTLGFLRGEQYAICLTLISSSKPVLGLIACPNLAFPSLASPTSTGSLFLASTSSGAFQSPLPTSSNPSPLHFTPIHTSPALSPPYKILESVEAGHSSHSINADIASKLSPPESTLDSVRMDSQTKYGALARGDGDLYLRVPTKFSGGKEYTEKIWDHASGALLVEEAGGKVSDVWGRPLDFGRGRMLNGNEGVIATASAIHSPALTAVRSAITTANPSLSPPTDAIAESIAADEAVADEVKEAEAEMEKGAQGQVIGEEQARPTS